MSDSESDDLSVEGKIDQARSEIEDKWKQRLRDAEDEFNRQNLAMAAELDKMRAAFSGDASGWSQQKNEEGEVVFVNSETGEEQETEPEVLYIAKAMQRVEKADVLHAEHKKLKARFVEIETKRKEAELHAAKLQRELDALRTLEKNWKEASKVIGTAFLNSKMQFDAQIDQVVFGLNEFSRVSDRFALSAERTRFIESRLIFLKNKVKEQADTISSQNVQIDRLQVDLAEQTEKVRRLSEGIEEEVNRLCIPIRKKLSDNIVLIMQEKAARAQERRELADLWPEGHLLPTILMRYRTLSARECETRKKAALQKEAARALAYEIRSKVTESRMWEVKYDEYGQQFFEHKQTGEAVREEPAIMKYTPPEGRDSLGGLLFLNESAKKMWEINTDFRGEIYYKHGQTGEVSYITPESYRKVPPAKSDAVMVGEAALLVLSYIKKKMRRFVKRQKILKEATDNPVDYMQIRKEKEEKAMAEMLFGSPDPQLASMEKDESVQKDGSDSDAEEDPDEDLGKYLYDIETVEMIAFEVDKTLFSDDARAGANGTAGQGSGANHNKPRPFLDEGAELRKFRTVEYDGPVFIRVDPDVVTVLELRDAVEKLTTDEEMLERRLAVVRDNLKDFSHALLQKLKEPPKKKLPLPVEEMEEESDYEDVDDEDEALDAKTAIDEAIARDDQSLADRSAQLSLHESISIEVAEGSIADSSVDVNAKLMPPETVPDPTIAPVEGYEILNDDGQVLGQFSGRGRLSSIRFDGPMFPLFWDEKSSNRQQSFISDSSGSRKTIEDTVDQLVDLSVFVGYNNLRIEDLYGDEEFTKRLSLNQPQAGMKPTSENDDEWFTNSFFLSLSAERLDPVLSAIYDDYMSAVTSQAAAAGQFAPMAQDSSLSPSHDDFMRESLCAAEEVVGIAGPLHTDSLLRRNFQREPGVDYEDLPRLLDSKADNAKTPLTNIAPESVEAQYALWKARQLTSEVLLYQFQREAMRDAAGMAFMKKTIFKAGATGLPNAVEPVAHPLSILPLPRNIAHIKNISAMSLKILGASFTGEALNEGWSLEKKFFVRLGIAAGRWTARTPALKVAGPRPVVSLYDTIKVVIENKQLAIEVRLPRHILQADHLHAELVEENASLFDPLLGRGSVRIAALLDRNLGSTMELTVPMLTAKKRHAGILTIMAVADDITTWRNELEVNKSAVEETVILKGSKPSDDARVAQARVTAGLRDEHLFFYRTGEDGKGCAGDDMAVDESINNARRRQRQLRIQYEEMHHLWQQTYSKPFARQVQYPTLPAQMSTFGSILSRLKSRGDGLIKLMAGDISLSEIWKDGHRISEGVVKPLPNFAASRAFLLAKAERHRTDMSGTLQELDAVRAALSGNLDALHAWAQVSLDESTAKIKKQLANAASAKENLQQVVEEIGRVRVPQPRPVEPFLEPIQTKCIPLIPEDLPDTDAEGNKMKRSVGKDIRVLEDLIAGGHMDGAPVLFGKSRPTKNQIQRLNAAIDKRNAILEGIVAQEEAKRAQVNDAYLDELLQWEERERVRLSEYERLKKESRKSYLRVDLLLEKASHLDKERVIIERDLTTLTELMVINRQAEERFNVLRAKQYLESCRQKKLLLELKAKLLNALDARARAFASVAGSRDSFEFCKSSLKAEEAFRHLRLEVYESKEALLAEGVRLRALHVEEFTCCRNELSRLRLMMEVISHRRSISSILVENTLELYRLYEYLDNMKMSEASKNDYDPEETVERLGERFLPDKKWISPDMLDCGKRIEFIAAKSRLSEEAHRAAGLVQKYVVESVSTKWSAEMIPVRDSWVENSDYVRSRELGLQLLHWVAIQHKNIAQKVHAIEHEATELKCEVESSRIDKEMGFAVQQSETAAMAQHTTNVIDAVMFRVEEEKRNAAEVQTRLETNLAELSKECQELREKHLTYSLEMEEKVKVLWGVIETFRTTVETMAQRIETLAEESEKNVIKSKLLADRVRFQLRLERSHSANLMFIIHMQKGFMTTLYSKIAKLEEEKLKVVQLTKAARSQSRKEIWEQTFVFSRLCTDVDALFDFFTARLANLSGARKALNESLAKNGAATVLAALCRSPRPIIQKWASRALAGLGWDGFVEPRILLWDSVMYWKMYKQRILSEEKDLFEMGLIKFSSGSKPRFEAVLDIECEPLSSEGENFTPSGAMSLRTLIKQRRQWVIRASRKYEGPNAANQKLLNHSNGVIQAALMMCDDTVRSQHNDWEVVRNAALTLSIASYEPQNQRAMAEDVKCVETIVELCRDNDCEIKTHAAVTVANLSHKDEQTQTLFGEKGVIPYLIDMCSFAVVDLLDAATSALSNLTCYSDVNCRRVLEADGVRVILTLLTFAHTENLFDLDHNDEIQANAIEALANVSRFYHEETAHFFDDSAVDALVLLCVSKNLQVRRHTPLVLGNIAQGDTTRAKIGRSGGIEALFLLLENKDLPIQANSLWSLCNLMWHPPNQERAGRFMDDILSFLNADYDPIRVHAMVLLANVLYYNSPNRVRFLESEGAMEYLMSVVYENRQPAILEAALRAVLSLSYLDFVALWLGEGDGASIPLFVSLIREPHVSAHIMLYSLEILCNLCVHHANRALLLRTGGVEAVVALQANDNEKVREVCKHIIEYLEDVTPAEVLMRARAAFGLEQMVTLMTNDDPLVRTVAVEAVGDAVWRDGVKQSRAVQIGALDSLLAVIDNAGEPVRSLLPALWSMRNLVHDNADAQAQFSYRDGVYVITSTIARILTGEYTDNTEKLLEASLAVLVVAISNHMRNSRRLLAVSLEVISDIADSRVPFALAGKPFVVHAMQSESSVALAKTILLLLAPYNFIVCRNCGRKQDLEGLNCIYCGHLLRVQVEEKESISLRKKGVTFVPPPPSSFAETRSKGHQRRREGHLLFSSSDPALPQNTSVLKSSPLKRVGDSDNYEADKFLSESASSPSRTASVDAQRANKTSLFAKEKSRTAKHRTDIMRSTTS